MAGKPSSQQNILQAALDVFADAGYDSGSLHTIAARVGIKTPSIYAHFQSKADLFNRVLEQALNSWESQVRQIFGKFQAEPDLKRSLNLILQEFIQTLVGTPAYRFWARVFTQPPPFLSAQELSRLREMDNLLGSLLVEHCTTRLPQNTNTAETEIFCTSLIFFVLGIMSYGELMPPENMKRLIERGVQFHLRALGAKEYHA